MAFDLFRSSEIRNPLGAALTTGEKRENPKREKRSYLRCGSEEEGAGVGEEEE